MFFIVNGYEGIHELLVTNGQSMSLRYRGSGILGFLYNNKGEYYRCSIPVQPVLYVYGEYCRHIISV